MRKIGDKLNEIKAQEQESREESERKSRLEALERQERIIASVGTLASVNRLSGYFLYRQPSWLETLRRRSDIFDGEELKTRIEVLVYRGGSGPGIYRLIGEPAEGYPLTVAAGFHEAETIILTDGSIVVQRRHLDPNSTKQRGLSGQFVPTRQSGEAIREIHGKDVRFAQIEATLTPGTDEYLCYKGLGNIANSIALAADMSGIPGL